MTLPACPQCQSEYTYEDQGHFVCPECAHEWNEQEGKTSEDELIVRDAHGEILQDGDTVTLIKDLKIKGSSQVIKQGTKVKGIRVQDGASNADHDIACRINGSPMNLKSEFVKKA